MFHAGCGVRVIGLAAVAVLLASAPAAAQGIEFGAKGGVNFANLAFVGADAAFDSRTGLVAGGFVTIPLGGPWSVQPEVLYSQEGATFDEVGAVGRIELDYLDVPILAQYRFGRFFVNGGPSFGIKLRGRQVLSFGDEEESIDLGEDVESFDFGVAAGGGYTLGRVTIEGRYTWGLRNVNAVDADGASVKTRQLSVLGGFRF